MTENMLFAPRVKNIEIFLFLFSYKKQSALAVLMCNDLLSLFFCQINVFNNIVQFTKMTV